VKKELPKLQMIYESNENQSTSAVRTSFLVEIETGAVVNAETDKNAP